MRNALVVGGNSGIGLSAACELVADNYDKVYIVGKHTPDFVAIEDSFKEKFKKHVVFYRVNLICEDYSVFDDIDDIETLIITVGFGRVSLFENLTDAEISNLMKVNFNSVVRIIKHYYNKISSTKDFYTAVMVSICGRVASPLFSVYGASKAAVRFFIENINCELSANNINNRILEVSPGSLKGTNFNGAGNNLVDLNNITKTLLDKMYSRETLYIPQYAEVYKDVIKRYTDNPIEFALDSYKYKLESGRVTYKPQLTIGYLSGTFDLFHIGHLNLLKRAKEQCDYLIVSVHNSGAWKGKETFIPYEERKAIVQSIQYVDFVAEDFQEDSDAWEKYHYNKLFVGSDYKDTKRFAKYEELLKGKAEIVYFPYTKQTSSTQLRNAISEKSHY